MITKYEQFVNEGLFFNKKGDILANSIINKIENQNIIIKKYGHESHNIEYYANVDNKKCIFIDGMRHLFIFNGERLSISENIIDKIKEIYTKQNTIQTPKISIRYPEMEMY